MTSRSRARSRHRVAASPARRGRVRGRRASCVHLASPFLPVPLAMVGLGIGLVGAAFMLAWAADAGEAVFSGGLVLAVIALVTVLPEFVIEIRFAYIQAGRAGHGQPDRRDAAPADGRDRPAAAGRACSPAGEGRPRRRSSSPTNRRLELGILLVTSLFADPDRRSGAA